MERPPAGAAPVLMLSRGGELDGAQRQLLYLAKGLDRSRYRPSLLLDSDGPFLSALHAAGIPAAVAPMRDWRRFPEALFRYTDSRQLHECARREKAAVIHASDIWKSPYAVTTAQKLRIPSVLHVRGPLAPRDIHKHGLCRASAVIAIARRYHEDLCRAGLPCARLHEIDDAVDLQQFHPNCPARSTLRHEWLMGDRLAVGLVGRIEAFKRVLEFLDVLAFLPPAVAQAAVFFLIGQEGPPAYMRRVHARIKELGLEQSVRFTGRRNDMPQVLCALDLLVTMSGGSIIFEAMASGTPVLSVRPDERFSIHARHDQTAWCLTTSNPQETAAGMERLLTDRCLRERLADSGMAWVREHLTVHAMVEKTQQVYDRLVAG